MCLRLLSLLLLWPSIVTAHAGLATTIPDHDAVLEQAPSVLHFQFMAQMTLTNVRLEIMAGARQGERIEVRLPRNSIGQSTAFGERVALELPPLPPAAYRVTWQAISIDGHSLLDDFNFTISESLPAE